MPSDGITVVGIGGSTSPGSSTEIALRAALAEVRRLGAHTECLTAQDLVLPYFSAGEARRGERERRLLEAMASADGLLIATPAYHGSVSGLMKNVLDYAEDLRERPEPYFSGRPVGCLTVASGAQGCVTALVSLRTTVHALRGWPTPLGVGIDTSKVAFGPDFDCLDPRVQGQLETMAGQIVDFARRRSSPVRQLELETARG